MYELIFNLNNLIEVMGMTDAIRYVTGQFTTEELEILFPPVEECDFHYDEPTPDPCECCRRDVSHCTECKHF